MFLLVLVLVRIAFTALLCITNSNHLSFIDFWIMEEKNQEKEGSSHYFIIYLYRLLDYKKKKALVILFYNLFELFEV